MGLRAELAQYLDRAGRRDETDPLPPNASFFERKTADLVAQVVGFEHEQGIEFQTLYRETTRRLLPLARLLTQPRSIAEFQELKRVLMETIHQDRKEASWTTRWLKRLLPELGIFPLQEMESIEISPSSQVWKGWESVRRRPLRSPGNKIVSLEKAVRIAATPALKRKASVGYIPGKFRLGPHSDHGRLFSAARECLGYFGLLFVGVESVTSIRQRIGQSALSDQERLLQVAGHSAVDFVILHTPSQDELIDLPTYYKGVQNQLPFNFWFIGAYDNPWREEFAKRAREKGAILLWDRPKTSLSTDELLNQIQAL